MKTYGYETFKTKDEMVVWMNDHSAEGTLISIIRQEVTFDDESWVVFYYTGS